MLTSDQLDALLPDVLDLYERYNQSVIEDIARRLASLDFARPTAAWQVQRLTESGLTYEAALERLALLTGRSETEIRKMFDKAGVRAMRFDDAIYRAAGLNPPPLNLSPAMVQVLFAGMRRSGNVVKNMTMTTALSGQDLFVRAADLAYMQVSSGALDYQTALRRAVKSVAREGLSVVNYASGRRDQLDVALRRTLLTGVNQTVGELQMTRAAEMGSDLVQVTAHAGARPAHALWQGKIYSRSGADKKYPALVSSTGYGTATGLMGVNCRHNFYPYVAGISSDYYDPEKVEALNNRTVTYNKVELSQYDASQEQRKIERDIRRAKREVAALQAAKLDNAQELARVKALQGQMRDFVKQTGLQRQPFREQI